MQVKKRNKPTAAAVPAPPARGGDSIVRKSVQANGIGIRSTRKNYGSTGALQSLIEPEIIQKGLFGYNDLSTFHSISVDMDTFNGSVSIISPVFSFKNLMFLFLSSTTLRDCIAAYRTNIESYGYELEYIGPEGKRDSRASKEEYKKVTALLATLVENGEGFDGARENSRIDKEVLGARAFEVMHDAAGRVVNINRIPPNTLLMTGLDQEYTEVEVFNPISKKFVKQKRRFRRFIQRNHRGSAVYFKELGDPRIISPVTGRVDDTLDVNEEATSIYYDAYYTPGTPYGTPQWSACIPSMLGAHEAELVNLSFFRDNAIPAMAVLVSGGALTEESFETISNYFTGTKGARENHNRIVVLEATPDVSEAAGVDGSISAPRVDIKTMLSDRQHEGLFSSYIEGASEKIRQAFRLPPLYIGSAEEYNRASAFASMQTAEQQVFQPERISWDRFMNNVVLVNWSLAYWRFKSASPVFNDPAEISSVLTVLGNHGALTPNVCIDLSNRFLGTTIESVTDDWGDMPFAVTAQAIVQGAKIPGFEYVFENIEKAVATVVPAETDDNDESDDTSSVSQVAVKKSVRTMLDEICEHGNRFSQFIRTAA